MGRPYRAKTGHSMWRITFQGYNWAHRGDPASSRCLESDTLKTSSLTGESTWTYSPDFLSHRLLGLGNWEGRPCTRRREPSLPPRLEDLEDLEEVDHCFFRPRPRGSALLLLGSEVAPDAWSLTGLSLLSSEGPVSENWAIFRDSMSCTSLSSSRIFSMVSPYHSSCQHQACRWALTITRRRPAQSQRTG